MDNNELLLRITDQTFYLFDQNQLSYLLPDSSERLMSNNHYKVRALLEKILTAAKKQSLIATDVTLWDFVQSISEMFRAKFNHRVELLQACNYAKDFAYPHDPSRFILENGFKVDDMAPVQSTPIEVEEHRGTRISTENIYRNDEYGDFYRNPHSSDEENYPEG